MAHVGCATDILIIGAGACRCLMANKLAAGGFSVVVLEAGKRLNPATDLPNMRSCVQVI